MTRHPPNKYAVIVRRKRRSTRLLSAGQIDVDGRRGTRGILDTALAVRINTDSASGRHYMSIAQGVHDAAVRRIVSYRWQDWKSEVVWMSLYFSVAVWLSIALVHAPERLARAHPRSPNH